MHIYIWILLPALIAEAGAQENSLDLANTCYHRNHLDTAAEIIDALVNNKEYETNPQVWLMRGKIYHAIFESDNLDFQEIHPEPLAEAVKSYTMSLQTDTDSAFIHGNIRRLKLAKRQFINRGIEDYKSGFFKISLESFNHALEINNLQWIQETDTSAVFNAGMAAWKTGFYTEAEKYFSQCAAMTYGGQEVFLHLADIYEINREKEKLEKILQSGIEQYPENNRRLILRLIDYYFIEGKRDAALNYFRELIENDSLNPRWYFLQGVFMEKIRQPGWAEESYKNAIRLDSAFTEVWFHLGALFYNQGVELMTKARDPKHAAEKATIKAQAREKFQRALPYIENAARLNPDDKSIIEVLFGIYTLLGMKEQAEEIMELR